MGLGTVSALFFNNYHSGFTIIKKCASLVKGNIQAFVSGWNTFCIFAHAAGY